MKPETKKIIDNVKEMMRLEGFEDNPEMDKLGAAFIEGKLTREEFDHRVRKLVISTEKFTEEEIEKISKDIDALFLYEEMILDEEESKHKKS